MRKAKDRMDSVVCLHAGYGRLLYTLFCILFSATLGDDNKIHLHSRGCVPGRNNSFNEKIAETETRPALKGQTLACVDGMASIYPCANVDLESFIPISDLDKSGNAYAANDIWGWESPVTSREYALVGLSSGTSFVDISDANNPVVIGFLETRTSSSNWRDIKTFNNYAFIVSEAKGHGMQIIDLLQLDNLTSFTDLKESSYYNNDEGIGQAHNVFINEDSGYAYVVGSMFGSNGCNGGLHIVDVNDATNPTFAGCYSMSGYTHDVQCIIYDGPDTRYRGNEICFASNEDRLNIIDVTDKQFPKRLSTFTYVDYGYTHQGWLTDDRKYFLIDDEQDEIISFDNSRTKTIICDVSDLLDPKYIGKHEAQNNAADHNQYVIGKYSYQANYQAGLRILDLSEISRGNLVEVGYFDIYPASDTNRLTGAWSNYPFFKSGIVVVSGIEEGLFVVKPNDLKPVPLPGLFQQLTSFLFSLPSMIISCFFLPFDMLPLIFLIIVCLPICLPLLLGSL